MSGKPAKMKDKVIVAGAAGFIGSNLVHRLMRNGWNVVSLDKLTYAGIRENLSCFDDNPKHTFCEGSINDRALLDELFAKHNPGAMINLAAESHVDRSIDDPGSFIETNIAGTYTILEAIRNYLINDGNDKSETFRFVHVSTDEVYGSIKDGAFSESHPFRPNSPYAASKASADCLVRSYHRTFGLPAIISNCSNNYGPLQFPEKLIPLVVQKAVSGELLPIYGDGKQERDWLFVEDHCAALETLLTDGTPGETYNIGGDACMQNIQLVEKICVILDKIKPREIGRYADLISYVPDRPGHDRRYAIDHSKLTSELGWKPGVDIDEGLELTVRWYLENDEWLKIAQGRGYGGQRLGLNANAGSTGG